MSKKKKITVIPPAVGLGNRMRVLSVCVQIAEKEDRELYVVWSNKSVLACEITDIFKSIGYDYTTPPKWKQFLLVQLYRHGAIKRFPGILRFITNIFYDSYVFDEDYDFNRAKLDPNDQSVLIATCFPFTYTPNFKNFKFIDYLYDEADKVSKKINGAYIGVHVRMTDHVAIMRDTPFEKYLNAIDNCIVADKNQKFFLATDDNKTKEFLTNKYGDRIYTADNKLGRDDLEGIYGGIIDLLLLSKSNKIICSPMSSYSDAAIVLGDIKEVINV